MSMQRGFRDKLDKYVNTGSEISVEMSSSGGSVYDYCCFGVDGAGRLSDDRYMVFYNQTSSPGGEISYAPGRGGAVFSLRLESLPPSVNKLVFTVSIDGSGSMGDISSFNLNIKQRGRSALDMALSGRDFSSEKAIIAIEIYKKDVWRVAAVAGGFNGGLAELLKSYGGEAMDEPSSAQQSAFAGGRGNSGRGKAARTDLSRLSLEKKLKKEAPELLKLSKPLQLQLDKHKLNDTVARVALVLDISGSMSERYRNGTVQEIVNRTLPLAVQFDDDGELDFWYYGTTCRRMDSVNMKNYRSAVPADWKGLMRQVGGRNNEPEVMRRVIDEYSDSKLPAYVLFITDGGVNMAAEIKRLLRESSRMPIFWQFVGVGGKNYGILEKFDTLDGRYVDNANFFALDDFKSVKPEELYRRLLNEFPAWLQEIKSRGMIR